MKEVPLAGRRGAGRTALVDDEDYELVIQHKWWVDEKEWIGARGCVVRSGPYAYGKIASPSGVKVRTFMHKLITGWPMTDHINHDGLDNRRENLRPTDKALNAANRRSYVGSSSPYKGVYWHTIWNKWAVRVTKGVKRVHVGGFDDEIEAALAYDRVALELFGEYAHLNFPAGSNRSIGNRQNGDM